MAKDKRPRYDLEPAQKKIAVASRWVSDDDSRRRISWRFGDAEVEGPWGWHRLTAADVAELHGKLSSIEKMEWGEATSGGYPMKMCRLDNAPAHLMGRLEETQRDDIDCLFEIRLGNMPRIWGARRGDVFHVLWWDPEHEVWPSQLRYT